MAFFWFIASVFYGALLAPLLCRLLYFLTRLGQEAMFTHWLIACIIAGSLYGYALQKLASGISPRARVIMCVVVGLTIALLGPNFVRAGGRSIVPDLLVLSFLPLSATGGMIARRNRPEASEAADL